MPSSLINIAQALATRVKGTEVGEQTQHQLDLREQRALTMS